MMLCVFMEQSANINRTTTAMFLIKLIEKPKILHSKRNQKCRNETKNYTANETKNVEIFTISGFR